jgi:hypothetical protein
MTTTGKRTGLLAAGLVVLIVGLLAGVGLWVSSTQRESDAVRNLARAPIDCDTTLSFEASGEYYVYIETAGRFEANLSGDCGAEGDYELSGDELPPVTLSLAAPNGDDVTLDSRADVSYDTAGYVGRSTRTFIVDEPGDYQLRVEVPGSTDAAFAAAVGRDPSDGVGAIRLGAAGAALGGLFIGGMLILLSRRSSDVEPGPVNAPWPGQTPGWPTGPPGMPGSLPTGVPNPLGPPTQHPVAPPGAPAAPTYGGGGAPQPPQTPQPQTPQPSPSPNGAPSAPTWGGVPNDGGSGEGRRSPWAPPSDSAQ